MASSGKFHIARSGYPSRSMTLQDINMGLASGEILPHDQFWVEGRPHWEPLKDLPGVVLTTLQRTRPAESSGQVATSQTVSPFARFAPPNPSKREPSSSGIKPATVALSNWSQPATQPQISVWSAVAYTLVSFLFTPLFGTWMIAQNHRAAGETIWRPIAYFWICLWSVAIIATVGMWLSPISLGSGLECCIALSGLWVIWFFTCALPHRNFLQARGFEARWRSDWGKPLCLGFLLWVALFVAFLVLR